MYASVQARTSSNYVELARGDEVSVIYFATLIFNSFLSRDVVLCAFSQDWIDDWNNNKLMAVSYKVHFERTIKNSRCEA